MTQAISPFYHTSPRNSGLARSLFDSVGLDYMPHRTRSETVAHHGLHTVRQYGENAIVGALLGAAHASGHLDVGAKKNIPLDLGIAGAAALYALVKSHDETATDARNIGALALGIFTFRQADAIVGTKRVAKGEARGVTKALAVHGEDDFGLDAGEDPILAFAKQL